MDAATGGRPRARTGSRSASSGSSPARPRRAGSCRSRPRGRRRATYSSAPVGLALGDEGRGRCAARTALGPRRAARRSGTTRGSPRGSGRAREPSRGRPLSDRTRKLSSKVPPWRESTRRRTTRARPYSRTRSSTAPAESSSHCHSGIHASFRRVRCVRSQPRRCPGRPRATPVTGTALGDGSGAVGRSGGLLGGPDTASARRTSASLGVARRPRPWRARGRERACSTSISWDSSACSDEDRDPVVGDREEPAVDGGDQVVAVGRR